MADHQAAVTFLTQLPRLTSLQLEYPPTLIGIEQLVQLTFLDLSPHGALDLYSMASLPHLQQQELRECSASFIGSISELTKLTWLELTSTAVCHDISSLKVGASLSLDQRRGCLKQCRAKYSCLHHDFRSLTCGHHHKPTSILENGKPQPGIKSPHAACAGDGRTAQRPQRRHSLPICAAVHASGLVLPHLCSQFASRHAGTHHSQSQHARQVPVVRSDATCNNFEQQI